jgi:hypothetical protein
MNRGRLKAPLVNKLKPTNTSFSNDIYLISFFIVSTDPHLKKKKKKKKKKNQHNIRNYPEKFSDL